MEKVRTMLSGVGLGQELWAVAIDTACYLKNKSPTSSVVNKTPHEVWSCKKPSISSQFFSLIENHLSKNLHMGKKTKKNISKDIFNHEVQYMTVKS